MLLLLILALWRDLRLSPWLMSLLLLIEVCAVNGLIAVNGGASNPFSALLLIPVVLAFMLLPFGYGVSVLLVSLVAQAAQLGLPAVGHHHQSVEMLSHSRNMVVSFMITSVLVAVVVCYFRYQIARREHAITQLRERQLRDEQLLAIGMSAAQLTHDVATPTQSIRLLLEEALEQTPAPVWLTELEQQFARIEQQLRNWREVADDVREQRWHLYPLPPLWRSLQQLMTVARPESPIKWHWQLDQTSGQLMADRTLLPALTSIIINACEAAADTLVAQVSVFSRIENKHWQLQIINSANALSLEQQDQLGGRLVASHKGHGVGAALSNATIEKFSGSVSWQLTDGTMLTTVTLPLRGSNAEPNHH